MAHTFHRSLLRPTTFAALTVALIGAATSSWAAEPTTTVEAVVRDFPRGDLPDGHPDFNTARNAEREGITFGMVEQLLGADARPVYNRGAAPEPGRQRSVDGRIRLRSVVPGHRWGSIFQSRDG